MVLKSYRDPGLGGSRGQEQLFLGTCHHHQAPRARTRARSIYTTYIYYRYNDRRTVLVILCITRTVITTNERKRRKYESPSALETNERTYYIDRSALVTFVTCRYALKYVRSVRIS